MIWTPEIVRARFHEAADTERYLERPRLPTGNSYWPLTLYTQEDRDGWTDGTKADMADQWARNRKLTREAISRHDECLIWSMTLLTKEVHRRIVWKWAFCEAYGRPSFRTVCREENWTRTVAYSRLDASFVTISDHLINVGAMLRLPDEKYQCQDEPPAAIKQIEFAPRTPAQIVHAPFRTEKHYDTLTTPEAIVAFVAHLGEMNKERRAFRARLERRAKAAAA